MENIKGVSEKRFGGVPESGRKTAAAGEVAPAAASDRAMEKSFDPADHFAGEIL